MSNSKDRSPLRISLDTYAVALALVLALLVRFNWIPSIRW
jgi:hypothetical protein